MNTKKNELSEKQIFFYTVGGISVVTGAVWLISKSIKRVNSTKEHNKSFEEGKSATYAKQIKMAFENDGWFGTDTESLRRVFQEIPSKEVFAQTSVSYKKMYYRNLYKDLQDELQSTEYNEMMAIIAGKPQKGTSKQPPSQKQYDSWAKRLRSAFNKSYGFMPGTDEDAIKAVFNEIPTQTHFYRVRVAYKRIYNADLYKDLNGELEYWEYSDYMKIIKSKPKK